MYVDDFALMSEIIKGYCNKFRRCEVAFVGESLKTNLVKTKVMICGVLQRMAHLSLSITHVAYAA